MKRIVKKILSKTHSIRTRIILLISLSTMLVFVIFSVVFNIALTQIIKRSAISQLESSTYLIGLADQLLPENSSEASATIISHIDNLPRGNYRIQPSAFEINADYEAAGKTPLSEIHKGILNGLKNSKLNLEDSDIKRINTTDGYYYISSYAMPKREGLTDTYMIIYVDVTGLANFASNINAFFFYLVASVLLLAISMAALLSGTIAKPIRKICMFAIRIGKGDFSLNDISYADTELNELNTVMNQTAKQLEIYDKDQKTFFQNASHELRTPLMSIKCYAEGIEYGIMEPKAASKTILAETDRLTDMVEDLLYVSRVDSLTPSYTTEDADLREIIKACADSQRSVAQSKQIDFVYDFDDDPVIFNCNKEFISRAITNLLSNAIRHAYSEIVLKCKKGDSGIVISVSDDGAGIAPDDLPHIFERFYKGSNGNHGIGLSIVKSIVEQHHGILSARNSNKGANFVIELPGKRR